VRDAKWVKDRTHESYAKTYAVVFPHDEPLAGRDARTSALHELLQARGCVHQARHGMERPGWFVEPSAHAPLGQVPKQPYDYYGAYADEGAWRLYGNSPTGGGDLPASIPKHDNHPYHALIDAECTFDWCASHPIIAGECHAARTGVAIFDQSYFGKFILTGRDADAAVQYLCTADMDPATRLPGSVAYTALCNHNGGVEADLTVTKLPDGSGYYFAAGGSTLTKDKAWIDAVCHARGYQVALADVTDDLAMISVQGPHARRLLAPLVEEEGALSHDAFKFSTCKAVTMLGHEVWCLRLTFVGELGFELHVPNECAADIYSAIRLRGEQYEAEVGVPVRDAGYRAIDSLSAEKGYRHWHADLTNKDTPLEAGIG